MRLAALAPQHPRRLVAGFAMVVWLAAAVLAVRAAPDAAGRPGLDAIGRDSVDSERLWRLGRLDSAHARYSAHMARARAARDDRNLLRALSLDAALNAGVGAGRAAAPELAEAMTLAAQLGDTVRMVRMLRWQAYLAGAQGDLDGQERHALRMRALAAATRDTTFELLSYSFTGWAAMQRGDLARARSEAQIAVRGYRARGDAAAEAVALQTLGSAELRARDDRAARATMRRKLELARATGNPYVIATALNDLGALELTIGDPAAGDSLYAEAARSHEQRGEWREATITLGNLARTRARLGRLHEAREAIDHALELAVREGYRTERDQLESFLGELDYRAGRAAAAKARWRRLLAHPDSLLPDLACRATMLRAAVLAEEDSLAEAHAALIALPRAVLARATQDERVEYEALLAGLAARTGAGAAAAARLDALATESERAGRLDTAARVGHDAARAWLALGRVDAARASFSRAADAWERERMRTADTEWRTIQGSGAGGFRLAETGISIELAESGRPLRERIAAAYAQAQRFKSRTFAERITGPGGAGAAGAPPTVAELQRDVLRPGELLLDVSVGSDTSTVFAVARDTLAVFRWPGSDALRTRLGDLRTFVADPRTAPAVAADTALAAAFAPLWDPLHPLVDAHPRRLLSPDGALQSLPLLPGHGATIVPLVTQLAADRRREPEPPATRVLAVLADAGRGPKALAGARREVEALARRIARVEVRGEADGLTPPTREDLAAAEALHVAGHVRLDDERPWHSAIVLGDAADSTGAALRAEDVARMRLHARLTVLSGCESAGGRAITGEGVSGLSSAFLIAGSRSVLASLWPVDDGTTATFMGHFYDGLARGRSAADALAGAQQAMQARTSTAHPFHWSGWVLIGDPDTRLELQRRPSVPGGAAAATAAVLAAVIAARRRRRNPPV